MNFYEYIAKTNPMGAKSVIQQFGYRVVDGRRMGDNLRMLVAQEGEPALRAIAELHPDKDLILEVFAPKKEDCGCNKKDSFMGADGTLTSAVLNNNQQQMQSDSTKLALQTNAMLIVATIIIASAIIVTRK